MVGRFTGWTTRHIDGPMNWGPFVVPGKDGLQAIVTHISPGAVPSMWDTFRGVQNSALPVTPIRPVYPFFYYGDYYEVTNEDFLSMSYPAFSHMNEIRAKPPSARPNVPAEIDDINFRYTPDTSAYNGIAKLENGATFPFPVGYVRTIGISGEAVMFPDRG